MADLVVLYKTPTDPKAFDKYYLESHIPLARKIPDRPLRSISLAPILEKSPERFSVAATGVLRGKP